MKLVLLALAGAGIYLLGKHVSESDNVQKGVAAAHLASDAVGYLQRKVAASGPSKPLTRDEKIAKGALEGALAYGADKAGIGYAAPLTGDAAQAAVRGGEALFDAIRRRL